jgi:hypothetical protein
VAKTRLHPWLAPWVFVLTGIVFNISRLLSIAIFVQVIGLILMLARDLQRN